MRNNASELLLLLLLVVVVVVVAAVVVVVVVVVVAATVLVVVVVVDQELKKECHGFCLHQQTYWFISIDHFLCSIHPLSCQPPTELLNYPLNNSHTHTHTHKRFVVSRRTKIKMYSYW